MMFIHDMMAPSLKTTAVFSSIEVLILLILGIFSQRISVSGGSLPSVPPGHLVLATVGQTPARAAQHSPAKGWKRS